MSQDVVAFRQAAERGGPASPCEAGCRSVCWKIFLLFNDTPPKDRLNALRAARDDYAAAREQHLQFIKHPERLTELTLDPLADDPESPWDVFRRDEVVRAEILQDVRRLPDNPLYHQDAIQTLILDVLFVFCKRHPHLGGYRQGMHELLAPLVAVLHEDACERDKDGGEDADKAELAEMLDAAMLEHDAYALFAAIMRNASRFYEFTTIQPQIRSGSSARTAEEDLVLASDPLASSVLAPAPATAPTPAPAAETSTIVEMSKAIHEDTLMRVDPELALHLQAIEVLPQIFLIRWIRLLFSREFPFDQLLVLWDRLFAVDPHLELVPLVCVAMLLRIRWELLDADYSLALQALLKYTPPAPPHSPHTFVADAVYLRDHLDAAGGAALILQYTGRAPVPTTDAAVAAADTTTTSEPANSTAASTTASTASTPSLPPAAAALAAGFGNLRNRTLRAARRSSPARHSSDGGRSSLDTTTVPGSPPPPSQPPRTPPLLPQPVLSPSPSPARFLQNNRESMEALLQSAAKGVLGRGQKLGINQAVRDAVGEIRRGIQEARQHAATAGGGQQQQQHQQPRRRIGLGRGFTAHGNSDSQQQQPLQDVHEAHLLVAEMERRNRQLAGLLDETVVALQALATEAAASATAESSTPPSPTPAAWRETVEIAAAKVQFVKVHLEDASLLLPEDGPGAAGGDSSDEDAEVARLSVASPASPPVVVSAVRPSPSDPLSAHPTPPPPAPTVEIPASTASTTTPAPEIKSPPPVRSTLAQSSLAWMLDDAGNADGGGGGSSSSGGGGALETSGSASAMPSPYLSHPASPPATATVPAGRRSTDRVRHAFLFGEPAAEGGSGSATAATITPAPPPAPSSPGNRRAISRSSGGGGMQRRAGVRSPVRVTAVSADDEVLGG